MVRRHRPRLALLSACAVLASLLGLLLFPADAARADTPWGSTGASYRSGLICALPDGRRVALASWAVDGTTAFSVADVTARGSTYGAAPINGAATDLAAGTRGLSAADLAALAYLIGHQGAGSSVEVAETSALVAQSFGGGAAQKQCLGRQGTSAAAAATLALAARRFAGPYTVQVSDVRAKPGSSAPVTATVLSASGVPTPGIAVTFAADGASATGVTGTNGRAGARLIVPPSGGAGVFTATVSEATGLRLIASTPESVALGTPQPVVARASIVPVLHPTPQVSVSGGTALVLAGGSITPTVTVAGTDGYSGTGTVNVVGPVQAPSGDTCTDATYADAPTAWSGTFAFAGDGPQPAGSTGALTPGCYAFAASVTTTDSTPAVTVKAAADPDEAVGVSAIRITQSVGSGLARTGVLTATVTATAATGAEVSATVTTYGPLPVAAGGHCDTGLTWTGAKVLSRSASVTLAGQGDRLTAGVRTPAVAATGCYALVARSTVSQDGRSAAVSAVPGAAGTTVTVIAPTLHVTDSAYDGRQGAPMNGTVHITGTLGLAGSVSVGLVSAPAPVTGCHELTFPATATTAQAGSSTTTVATAGDGDYPFRSPAATQNRCYGVVATLTMSADSTVRVDASAPGDTSVFLAGADAPSSTRVTTHAAAQVRQSREVVVLGITGGVVLLVALALMATAAVVGERKPDPRAGELLVDFNASA